MEKCRIDIFEFKFAGLLPFKLDEKEIVSKLQKPHLSIVHNINCTKVPIYYARTMNLSSLLSCNQIFFRFLKLSQKHTWSWST